VCENMFCTKEKECTINSVSIICRHYRRDEVSLYIIIICAKIVSCNVSVDSVSTVYIIYIYICKYTHIYIYIYELVFTYIHTYTYIYM